MMTGNFNLLPETQTLLMHFYGGNERRSDFRESFKGIFGPRSLFKALIFQNPYLSDTEGPSQSLALLPPCISAAIVLF